MTEAADAKPEPGWYSLIRDKDGRVSAIHYSGGDTPWLYYGTRLDKIQPGWTLGPKIADLLRAVAWPIGVGGETMTEAADAKPEVEIGWYAIVNNKGELVTCWWNQDLSPLPESGYPRGSIADLLRAVAGPIGVGWELIETAPKDGKPVWAYVAMAHGLPPFEDKIPWHPDAGWCADELRPVTHWHPETTKMLRDAARYRWLRDGHRLSEVFIGRGDDAVNLDNETPEQIDAIIDAELSAERNLEDKT